MKTHTQDYTDQEETRKRKPIELYHLWRDGGTHWRYTNHNLPVSYGGNTFDPAVINRGSVKYDSQFEVTKLSVSAGYLEDPVMEYISQNPVELIWIEVLRFFEDVSPEEVSVIFIGQIKTTSFQGNIVSIECVGFEHYLHQRIPRFRIQLGCNNDLYDDFCGIDKDSWKITTTITSVDSDGVVLTSSDFALQDDGYYTRGYIQWGDYYRMIVDHVEDDITLRFRMPGFASGQEIDAYAGCDKQLATCHDKFDNVNNFFGHPWLPLDNPALWIESHKEF
jgi:uncharacterized phage protein (TIGR02218 family)